LILEYFLWKINYHAKQINQYFKTLREIFDYQFLAEFRKEKSVNDF